MKVVDWRLLRTTIINDAIQSDALIIVYEWYLILFIFVTGNFHQKEEEEAEGGSSWCWIIFFVFRFLIRLMWKYIKFDFYVEN